jgi:hypothetical protein
MNELTPFYNPLQYPLLFFVREYGWFENLLLQNNQDETCTWVSMVVYYAQKTHFSNELSTLHFGGCLFQQYIIDVATKTK